MALEYERRLLVGLGRKQISSLRGQLQRLEQAVERQR
jgi:hypothetical protein